MLRPTDRGRGFQRRPEVLLDYALRDRAGSEVAQQGLSRCIRRAHSPDCCRRRPDWTVVSG